MGGGGGVLINLKYARCDTAPVLCDRAKKCVGRILLKVPVIHAFTLDP